MTFADCKISLVKQKFPEGFDVVKIAVNQDLRSEVIFIASDSDGKLALYHLWLDNEFRKDDKYQFKKIKDLGKKETPDYLGFDKGDIIIAYKNTKNGCSVSVERVSLVNRSLDLAIGHWLKLAKK